jgi:hypothetical protein
MEIHASDRLPIPGTVSTSTDFSNSMSFIQGGPVFSLPAGYTANSIDGRIVDNVYVGLPALVPAIGRSAVIFLGLSMVAMGSWVLSRRVSRAVQSTATTLHCTRGPRLRPPLPLYRTKRPSELHGSGGVVFVGVSGVWRCFRGDTIIPPRGTWEPGCAAPSVSRGRAARLHREHCCRWGRGGASRPQRRSGRAPP